MRTTQKRGLGVDLLHPGAIFFFVALVVLWIVFATLPDWEAFAPRAVARIAGYVGFLAMLVPYVHIVRRSFRHRQPRRMTFWLRLHIGAAYLALLMVIIHSRGRANGPVTLALVWLTWIVMVSGVVGYYGQKLLYYVLPKIVTRELGLERLEPQRTLVLATAEGLLKKPEMQAGPEIIQKFCAATLAQSLSPPYSLRTWLFARADFDALSENRYQHTRSYADPKQAVVLEQLWELVKARRDMDLEYRLHQLGRLWLLVHGPAAWALLVLMIEHAVMSIYFGGL